jgi:hypothetical protein
VAFGVGAIPYVAISVSPSTVGLVGSFFSDFGPTLSLRDVVLWGAFLGYQFPGGLPLAPLGLAWLWRRRRHVAVTLALAYLGSLVAAVGYRVTHQYVFYLPSYLMVVICIGVGYTALSRWRPILSNPAPRVVLLVLLLAVPIALYRVAPLVLNSLQMNPLNVRALPGRDNNTFFLWPPKHGYQGAREFGEQVLATLPPDSVLLADWTPLECLRYLQAVEGRRPDVTLIELYGDRQVPYLLEQSETRPVFIAGTQLYYDMSGIRRYFDVLPFGPVYRLERHR